ncbi:putative MFS family arabinose efflux permease [Pararhizobium capsulatum DSM 1112]|uniref:MFS family arabinose efflux permease n=1 Tax=Pararhizobium capsulatum DSM 1112 TaxID=1121113 RepID=A0ABU0BNM6_9HYPH|nr:MFS transporter [Pararhizobium capsulatum]MDQ0319849.1 putative MFS family arabinose efflux permease [Pararhizobium capsulatum DSM 1112]
MAAASGEAQGTASLLRSARRNVYLLTAAQAVLGTMGPVTFSVGGVAGYQLLGNDKSLATAPLTGFNIGVAIGAIFVALLSRVLGRQTAFIVGALLGAAGGVLAAYALYLADFWLFAISLLVIGLSGGFTQKLRFAAADASPSFYKPRAISWILAGGMVSAVLGPQLVIQTRDMLAPIFFAGAFLAVVPVCLVAIIFLALLRLPDQRPAVNAATALPMRPLREIVLTQRFITGMVCGISTYALMTFMMTGAPIAMVIGCGFSQDMATLGIQWHVLAMFVPSFFTGMLVSRFGAEKVVASGLFILMACALVAHAGIELWNFWGALILLGLGWNFGFIGSTAIVAASYRPEEADKVQGFHDIILFAAVALASFGSGKVLTAYGWDMLNAAVWPLTFFCLFLLFALFFREKPRSA